MTRILLVEDDAAIRDALRRSLTERGHVVATAGAGLTGLEMLLNGEPEVVLLDLGLPDVDGLTLIPMMRAARDTPIVVITAQDDDPTIVKALDTGADDYVVKPFGSAQLEARIRAVLRRTAGERSVREEYSIAELHLDIPSRIATLAGVPLDLARKEFDMLHLLASREGEVVTKRELLADVWQQPYGGSERTVDVHLSWLRRKLGESAAEPRYLHSVRGVGVRLVAPSEA
ncbi:MAG TPA: response regulator transcription factor [Marmoricola sp.]|nr:response regulator transcription factor [Marmoricola sp.]